MRNGNTQYLRSFIRCHPDEELVAYLAGKEIPATAEFV